MTRRVLVAGVGNIFFGDDGFGVEVVRRIREAGVPAAWAGDVDVRDIGIRGIHLLYELMDGCELLVLVDAAARGEAPGTVSVVDPGSATGPAPGAGLLDAHGLAPDQLLAAVAGLGAATGRALVVACEPRSLDAGIGLSAPVLAAVPAAVETVAALVEAHLTDHPAGPGAIAHHPSTPVAEYPRTEPSHA